MQWKLWRLFVIRNLLKENLKKKRFCWFSCSTSLKRMERHTNEKIDMPIKRNVRNVKNELETNWNESITTPTAIEFILEKVFIRNAGSRIAIERSCRLQRLKRRERMDNEWNVRNDNYDYDKRKGRLKCNINDCKAQQLGLSSVAVVLLSSITLWKHLLSITFLTYSFHSYPV